MDKFLIWVGRNRKVLGYSIGGLAFVSGVAAMAAGHTLNGACTAFLGLIILFDTASSI